MDLVLVERPTEHVAHVVLNRPERRNALTGPLADPRDVRWTRRTGVVKLTYLKAF